MLIVNLGAALVAITTAADLIAAPPHRRTAHRPCPCSGAPPPVEAPVPVTPIPVEVPVPVPVKAPIPASITMSQDHDVGGDLVFLPGIDHFEPLLTGNNMGATATHDQTHHAMPSLPTPTHGPTRHGIPSLPPMIGLNNPSTYTAVHPTNFSTIRQGTVLVDKDLFNWEMVCPTYSELQDKNKRKYNTVFKDCSPDHARTHYIYRGRFNPEKGYAPSSSSNAEITEFAKELTELRKSIMNRSQENFVSTFIRKLGTGEAVGGAHVKLKCPATGQPILTMDNLLGAVSDADQMAEEKHQKAVCEFMCGIHKVASGGVRNKLVVIDNVLASLTPPISFPTSNSSYGMVSIIMTYRMQSLNKRLQGKMESRLGWKLVKKKPSRDCSEIRYSGGKAYIVQSGPYSHGAEGESGLGSLGPSSRSVGLSDASTDKLKFKEMVSRHGKEEVQKWCTELFCPQPLPVMVAPAGRSQTPTGDSVSNVTMDSVIANVNVSKFLFLPYFTAHCSSLCANQIQLLILNPARPWAINSQLKGRLKELQEPELVWKQRRSRGQQQRIRAERLWGWGKRQQAGQWRRQQAGQWQRRQARRRRRRQARRQQWQEQRRQLQQAAWRCWWQQQH